MVVGNLELGRLGEDAALRRYRDLGYSLLARNWRCKVGEIDLVVSRAGVVVFCEVKTRSSGAYGGGFESVTQRKQAKVRSVAVQFLAWNGVTPRAIRFDVASVAVRARGGAFDVHLFEDAF
jgi:putative endonuclease